MPLAVQELDEIKAYVLRELPRVLEQDPQFVVFIEGLISEKFPRRDEFARLLDEFTSFRKETRENFDKMDQRFDCVDQRFEGMDQRFEQVDQRFEQVDQRFDRVDQRFEGMDQRFEQVDQRLEGVDQRLEGVDQRLEGVDQRLEGVDQRLEGVDQRLDRMDQRLEGVDHGLSSLTEEVRNLRDWVEMIAGGLQRRAGENLEKVVAGALSLGLQRPDIQPEQIKLRQKLFDPEGLVFKAGKRKEVDLVVQDGELLVFEVKSAPKADDVDNFADKVELVRLQNPDKQVQGVFVAVGSEEYIRQHCQQHEIILIP